MNRVLLLGDSGSGKTTLMRKMKEGVFSKEFKHSESIISYIVKNNLYIEIPGSYKAEDWSLYDWRDVKKVFIMTDKSSLTSLKNAFKYWIPTCKKMEINCEITILVNKNDLETSQSFEDYLYELNRDNLTVKRLSAKNDVNISL